MKKKATKKAEPEPPRPRQTGGEPAKWGLVVNDRYYARGPAGRPKPGAQQERPIALALGVPSNALLKLVLREGADVRIGEVVYVGTEPARREKIDHVQGRLDEEELILEAVERHENEILDLWFNHEKERIERRALRLVFNRPDTQPIPTVHVAGDIYKGQGKAYRFRGRPTGQRNFLQAFGIPASRVREMANEIKLRGPFRTIDDMCTRIAGLSAITIRTGMREQVLRELCGLRPFVLTRDPPKEKR